VQTLLGVAQTGFPATLVHDALGQYHYVWSVPLAQTIATYDVHFVGYVGGAPYDGWDTVYVVAAGSIPATGIFDLTAGKARLGIADTKDDTLIQSFIDSITNTLQNITGCWFQGDTVDRTLYFDGYEARGGMIMPVPVGIQSITTLELSQMTGGSYATVPINDPNPASRIPRSR
jgi:hypothetical protein